MNSLVLNEAIFMGETKMHRDRNMDRLFRAKRDRIIFSETNGRYLVMQLCMGTKRMRIYRASLL